MALKRVKLHVENIFVVVAFDICSSSDILEELTLKGDMKRFKRFLTAIKMYLMEMQKTIAFDAYKFTGDGWILLFPENTEGKELLKFLRNLCAFFKKELRNQILQYLDTPPSITGLTFGLEKGPLMAMLMYGKTEYVGRALNIACRLQNAVKDKGKSPAYNALVSNAVFKDYLYPATGFEAFKVKRTLRNIHGGDDFRCIKIELLNS
jgi:hypothetical protein